MAQINNLLDGSVSTNLDGLNSRGVKALAGILLQVLTSESEVAAADHDRAVSLNKTTLNKFKCLQEFYGYDQSLNQILEFLIDEHIERHAIPIRKNSINYEVNEPTKGYEFQGAGDVLTNFISNHTTSKSRRSRKSSSEMPPKKCREVVNIEQSDKPIKIHRYVPHKMLQKVNQAA